MTLLALRPRSASEIADASFNLFRSNASTLLSVSAILYLPLIVANVLFAPAQGSVEPGDFLVMFLLSLFGMFWYGIVAGALTWAASELYLGRQVTPGAVISAAFARPFRLMFGMWARWLLIVAGMFLLLIGAVYAFIFSFAMIAAIVIEGRTVNQAWVRSKELASGMKMHIFLTELLAYLVLFVLFVGVILISPMLVGTNEAVLHVLQGVAGIVVFPFIASMETLLYYDTRIRKEGFDIEHMTSAIGEPIRQPA